MMGPGYASGVGHWGTQTLASTPQHPLVLIQADPGGQVALVVQGVAAPAGTEGGQMDPASVTQTMLPSVLWPQKHVGLPHAVPDPIGQNVVAVAGQVLLGKQEPD